MIIKKNKLRSVLIYWYENIAKPIEVICSGLMVLSVFFTVMLREVFNFNISWGYEIAAFWAVIIVFLAMPHNIYEKADLRVGVIYDMLGGKIKAFIDVIHFFCTSFVLYGMTIAFYQYITRLGKYRQPATNFTNGFFFGIIGVGIIVSSLELIARIIDVLITLKGDKNTDNKLRNMNGDTL